MCQYLFFIESKDNVHISVLPPGVNPDSDLSKYITNTQYYPVRRTAGLRTANYVPSFLDPPLPKPKPFRKVLKRRKPFETKKVHHERKTVKLSDNSPKTVKLNGYEAPATLPYPTPRSNKYIITKNGNKDIESSSEKIESRFPDNVLRSKPSFNRVRQANENYENRNSFSNNIKSKISSNVVSKPARVESNVPFNFGRKQFTYNDFYV